MKYKIEEQNISIETFSKKLDLEIVYSGTNKTIKFKTYNVNRPGLQLAGFYTHYSSDRVQVLGEMEKTYLDLLEKEKRLEVCNKLFEIGFPCLIISSHLSFHEELLYSAKKYNRVLLRARARTTPLINDVSFFLNELLAPTITMHGELVDVYGVGILILGNGSVGKSETALELIQRNHRLIADDAVIIKRINDNLIGSAPKTIKHLLEVRGLGIINIINMFGASAIKDTKKIDLVAKFEIWDENKIYDRLGNAKEFYEILGIKVTQNTIPVKPGRNLSIIIETAARKHRLKSIGENPLKSLDNLWKKH